MAKRQGENRLCFGLKVYKADIDRLMRVTPEPTRNAAIVKAIRFYAEETEKAKTPAA